MTAAMIAAVLLPLASAGAIEYIKVPTGSPGVFGSTKRPAVGKASFREWHGMLSRHARQIDQERATPCEPGLFTRCHLRTWQSFVTEISNDSLMDKVKFVNSFANRIRYIPDIRNYQKSDFWATVREFLKNFGDCEDYAITKYFSLKNLGVPVGDMRIVVLKDMNIQEYHAILAVDVRGFTFVLDNQTDVVVEARKIRHYLPIYSINEHGAWFHVR